MDKGGEGHFADIISGSFLMFRRLRTAAATFQAVNWKSAFAVSHKAFQDFATKSLPEICEANAPEECIEDGPFA